MRVGSSVKSDNFTAYDTLITPHSIVQWREVLETLPRVATTCPYAHAQRLHRRFLQEEWGRFPQVRIQTLINSMRIRIEACGGPIRYWFSSLDNMCVWSVCLSYEIVTFTWPRPDYMCCKINIVCSISFKIGLNVHEWFLSPSVPHRILIQVLILIAEQRACVIGVS